MKKILFCTGLLALAASCANDELESLSKHNEGTKGITFEATIDGGSSTRGEITEDNGTYPFFWYAEQDEINIFGFNNVEAGSDNSGSKGLATLNSNDWTLTNGAATYKATKSEANGYFTAKAPAEMLEFTHPMTAADDTDAKKADKTATFVAAYKANITKVNTDATGKEVKSIELTLPTANNAQTIDAAITPNASLAPMFSVSKGYKTENYQSVGEKVNLKFIRPLALAKFKTAGIDESYSTLFGKLQSIKLTAKGSADPAVAASKIAYSSASKKVTVDVTDVAKSTFEAGEVEAITLTYTSGKAWTDKDAAFMTLLPVDRQAFRTADVKEELEVVFTFENIVFTVGADKGFATNADWTALTKTGGNNGVVPMPALDINSFPFLVTTSNALIVNKGKFSDIYKQDGNINWGTGVDPTSITTIISNVALTDAELTSLKTKFTGLTSITLNENTTIPAGTFSKTQAEAMTALNLPKVTTIDKAFVAEGAFTKLATLIMPSYGFTDEAVNKVFFNDNTKSKLEKLDISGVASLAPLYGVERSLSFQGYEALVEVTVKNNVVLSANAFNGCTKLVTVNNTVDLRSGNFAATSAFEGCKVLTKINITGTEIPASAFKDCKALVDVLVNQTQVVPTKVGASAFEGTTVLKYMDLTSATEIDKAAFKSSGLEGSKKDAEDLKVGAAKITEESFAGIPAKRVQFTNAISIEDKILDNAVNLNQVKFMKAFTVNEAKTATWSATMFGTTPANVVLFINKDQKYIASVGAALELPWLNVDVADKTTIKFKGIEEAK